MGVRCGRRRVVDLRLEVQALMALAALYNIPATEPEFMSWAFAHAAHHRDIIRAIYQNTGVSLQEFVLDPFDPKNPQTWLYQHQIMHKDMDAVLGISGYDLLDVDFQNRDNFAGWVWLNADEHRQAALGLGPALG